MEQISKKYMIFDVSELNQINFNEVLETNINTVRKSIDGTKTFVKWYGETPLSVLNLKTKEGPYSNDQILEILSTPEWSE